MWFRWFRNYPERYKAMHRGAGYAFAILGAITGTVWFIVDGFKNFEALILAGVSVGLFFLIRMLTKNTIVPANEEEREEPQDRG